MFPTLFRWGGFSLQDYGLFIAVGFLLGIGLALKEARRKGLPGERILDLSLVIIISAIIGSRLLYVIINYPQYLKEPLSIFKIWEGGLVFFGGLILAFMVGGWYIKKTGLPFWETADLLAPSLAMGQVFGRLGCLAAGCCYGRPTQVPWAVTFSHPECLAPTGIALHPTQLYESLIAMGLFFLLILMRRKKIFAGQLIVAYLFFSGWARWLVEFFRGDYRGNLLGGGWSDTQYLSGLIILLSLGLGLYLLKRKEKL
jgi:phosphatidylglycerol:prolipoprotein diacylglycerol transferase